MKKLDQSFYTKNTLVVAKALLGKYLYLNKDGKQLIAKIVETEAYIGPIDKACHTYNGKRTTRTDVMYKGGGYVYIYQIYGMYYCLNVVTEDDTVGTAVLIRAVEPIEGTEYMALNRYSRNINELSRKELINLTNGPGKLCMALGLDKRANGDSLLGEHFYIFSEDANKEIEVMSTKRININYAEEAKDFEWRFYIKNNPYVSKVSG